MITRDVLYAEVIVSILRAELDRVFYYSVPDELKDVVVPGCRVSVPFGRRSIEGCVIGFSEPTIDVSRIKDITAVLDDYPLLTPAMLELAKWMKVKYYTTLAACLRCVVPAWATAGKRGRKRKTAVVEAAGYSGDRGRSPLQLTGEQISALDVLFSAERSQTHLIHGVTGSGKT